MSQQSLRDKLPFPAAAIIGLLYFTFNIFNRFFSEAVYGYGFNINVVNIIFYSLVLSIVILLFIKLPNLGFTVALGILSTLELYWLVVDLHFIVRFDQFRLSTVLPYTIYLIAFSTFTLLCVQSISTYTNLKLNILNKIWFLPGILLFFYVTIMVVEFFSYLIDFPYYSYSGITVRLLFEISRIILQVLYATFALLLGKWFKDVAHIKHQDSASVQNTTNITNMPNTQNNFYAAPQPQYRPQPQVTYHNTAPTYAKPVVQQAIPQPASQTDTVEELKKYKDIFEKGLITEEEYNAKKKQILGL